MGALSNIFENALLNHIFHYDVYTYPRTAMVIALWIGSPTDTGEGGVEVSGGGYARLETVPGAWTTATGGVLANSIPFLFPAAITPWGTVGSPISHFALFSTVSVMLFHGALAETKVIEAGQVALFPPTSLLVYLE